MNPKSALDQFTAQSSGTPVVYERSTCVIRFADREKALAAQRKLRAHAELVAALQALLRCDALNCGSLSPEALSACNQARHALAQAANE